MDKLISYTLEFLVWMFTGIIPPTDLTDQVKMRKWMKATAGALAVWSFVLIAFALAAFGFIAPFYPGFAKAQDMSKFVTIAQADIANTKLQNVINKNSDILATILNNQRENKIRDLDQQLISARTKECHIDPNNHDALQFAWTKIRQLNDQWEDEHQGRPYELPPCDQL